MATKKAKKSTKKAATTNFDRIVKTAKSVNKEVLNTATQLLEDAKGNGVTLRSGATTILEKVQIKDSFNKVLKTTKKVNTQVIETASEVLEDVVETSKMWGAATLETVKNRMEDIDVKANVNQLKTTAKNVNDLALATADDLLEDALENSKEWQGVADKAVKGGLHLAERQQEIVFDTLETVKGQLLHSASRIKTLFSKN